MQELFSYLVAFQVYFMTSGSTLLPYVGIGYDIVRGNPDAWDWSKLGQDPGLLITRTILRTSIDGTPFVKQVPYPHCIPSTSTSVFYDPKSYQDYLKNYIRISSMLNYVYNLFSWFFFKIILLLNVSLYFILLSRGIVINNSFYTSILKFIYQWNMLFNIIVGSSRNEVSDFAFTKNQCKYFLNQIFSE